MKQEWMDNALGEEGWRKCWPDAQTVALHWDLVCFTMVTVVYPIITFLKYVGELPIRRSVFVVRCYSQSYRGSVGKLLSCACPGASCSSYRNDRGNHYIFFQFIKTRCPVSI